MPVFVRKVSLGEVFGAAYDNVREVGLRAPVLCERLQTSL